MPVKSVVAQNPPVCASHTHIKTTEQHLAFRHHSKQARDKHGLARILRRQREIFQSLGYLYEAATESSELMTSEDGDNDW
ncbi:hypothetical protein TNCV_57581 [Trichonephila clavipes]|nr:hypothetical protein TNCV_57581 [Trichonephila clavipes]